MVAAGGDAPRARARRVSGAKPLFLALFLLNLELISTLTQFLAFLPVVDSNLPGIVADIDHDPIMCII